MIALKDGQASQSEKKLKIPEAELRSQTSVFWLHQVLNDSKGLSI